MEVPKRWHFAGQHYIDCSPACRNGQGCTGQSRTAAGEWQDRRTGTGFARLL